MKEFELIATVFARLAAKGPPAFGLSDDAAVWTPPAGRDLVFTKDLMIAGRHFFADDAPDLVARKLMRVNLSDLAAMGAVPHGYLLGFAADGGFKRQWAQRFAAGLARDAQEFSCPLMGGDTVAGAGRLTLSLTAIGSVPAGRALLRSGAKPGDLIFVSGTLGDAALGLMGLKGEIESVPALVDRYYLPQPRLTLGAGLVGIASACIDVSDGFAADLGHICEASDVGARVRAADLPISAAARPLIAAKPELLLSVAGGGDDYELVFTAPAATADAVAAAAERAGVPVTEVGAVTAGTGVEIVGSDGEAIALERAGYVHGEADG